MASVQLPAQDFSDIAEVYERFATLTALSPELGGSFLLYSELDRGGIALAMVANIAGAASLGLEPDLARAKQSIRIGACDFLVNTLDEALRILKNEIRKKKPVSVALVGDPGEAVAEIVERGVQPEFITERAAGIEPLVERGTRRLSSGLGQSGMVVTWGVAREPLQWLPALDRLAAGALDPAASAARRRWIETSPRYLGRLMSGRRYLRMSAMEGVAFVSAVRREVESGGIRVAVTVVRDGVETVIGS